MKILMVAALCASLSMVTAAWSQNQDASQSGGQASQSNQNQATQNQSSTNSGNQSMSGTVSHNGKSVTSDKNSKSYKVDNPETLKGKEDQHVALIVQVDPDNNVIHIIQVEPQQ